MDALPANELIRYDIDTFWHSKLRPLTTADEVQLFVREYLPLIGIEYDISIAKAILQLKRLSATEVQPLTSQLTTLAIQICDEQATAARLKLWRQLAQTVGYTAEITTLAVQLNTRARVVQYIKTMLADDHQKLWPLHDIAYKIVDVMAHYTIDPNDQPLYTIWDRATEIETMSASDIEASGAWNELLRLRSALS